MYEKVYEISKFPVPMEAVGLFLISGAILYLIIQQGYYTIVGFKKYGPFYVQALGRTVLVIMMIYGFVFFISAAIYSVSYGGSEEYEFAEKYYNEEYETISGVVKNFKPKYTTDDENYHSESFCVEDVVFEYGDAIPGGFENHGGEIYKNGQEVRICYVLYNIEPGFDRNVIVKLELKEE